MPGAEDGRGGSVSSGTVVSELPLTCCISGARDLSGPARSSPGEESSSSGVSVLTSALDAVGVALDSSPDFSKLTLFFKPEYNSPDFENGKTSPKVGGYP